MRIPDLMWKYATTEQRDLLRDLHAKIKVQSQSTNVQQIPHQYRHNQPGRGDPGRGDQNDVTPVKAQQAVATATDSSDSEDEDPTVAQFGDIEHRMRSLF